MKRLSQSGRFPLVCVRQDKTLPLPIISFTDRRYQIIT